MKFQLKEKPIYSESYLLHFGEPDIFGDLVNNQFPDYTGISIGAIIYMSHNIEELTKLKNHLECLRMRSLNEAVISFFDDDTIASKYYASDQYSQLKNYYAEEFDLQLSISSQMEVNKGSFYIPNEADEQQITHIQKLLGLEFYYIEESSVEDQLAHENIDWKHRLSMLNPSKKLASRPDENTILDIAKDDASTTKDSTNQAELTPPKKHKSHQPYKPWWKLW